MNQMRYANFPTLLDSQASSRGVRRNPSSGELLSGTHMLTILAKEGFAGVNKIYETAQELELGTRQAVNKVLQENPILNPRDEEYLQEVRAYVRSEVKGKFYR